MIGILAIISLSLAIVNLFPFLPLDGGHIFWAIVEKVRGARCRCRDGTGRGGGLHARDPDLPDRAFERHRPPERRGLPTRVPPRPAAARPAAKSGKAWRKPNRHVGARPSPPAGLCAAEHPLAEAFQRDGARPRPPGRASASATKGDEFSITWREYAERVEATAGGLAGLGLGRGDTLAIMLTNRPEFHWFDSAALHLGATPFSLYNTYTPSRSSTRWRTRARGYSSRRRPSPSERRA